MKTEPLKIVGTRKVQNVQKKAQNCSALIIQKCSTAVT